MFENDITDSGQTNNPTGGSQGLQVLREPASLAPLESVGPWQFGEPEVTQESLYKYTECHKTMNLKGIDFVLCTFYFYHIFLN